MSDPVLSILWAFTHGLLTISYEAVTTVIILCLRKLKHGDFKLQCGGVRLQGSCSWQLFYSSLLSCETGHSRYHSSEKDLLEQKVELWTQSWSSHEKVLMLFSLSIFMEEFTLNLQDSIYRVEAEKDVGKKRLQHDICLMWIPFVRLGIEFR